MRDYRGVVLHRVEDPRAREALSTIDIFLRDLTLGMGRIQRGLEPNSSGDPIVGPFFDDFWYKPGILGEFKAYMQTTSGGSGFISSTSHLIKGKIYLGAAKTSVFDEANERIGLNTASPDARLHMKVPDVAATFHPNGSSGVFTAVGAASIHAAVQSNDGDTSYAQSGAGNSSSAVKYSFSFTRPATNTGWVLKAYMKKFVDGSPTATTMNTVLLEIINGAIGGGGSTAISESGTWTVSDTSQYVLFSRTLSSGEAAAITDTTNFHTHWVVNGSGGSAGDQARTYALITEWFFDYTEGVSADAVTLQKWATPTFDDQLDFTGDGSGSGVDITLTGDAPLRINSGGGTSGLRLLTSSTNGRLEVGTSAQANMNLVLSGARDATATLITSKATTHAFTGVVQIQGGTPAAGQVLTASNASGDATWETHNLLSATHGDTLAASVVLGDLVYGNSTPAWQRLAGNNTTTKKFLNQTGNGTISAAPSWDAIAAADLPAHDHSSSTQGGATLNVPDATFTITDNLDATKKFQFQASGITTGTTRTYTTPNLNGVIPLATSVSGAGVNLFDSSHLCEFQDNFRLSDVAATGFFSYWFCPTLANTTTNYVPRAASGTMAVIDQNFGSGGTGTDGDQLPAGAMLYGFGVTAGLRTLPIGASGTILTSTGSAPQWSTNAAVVDVARTWTTLQKFPDEQFQILGSAVATRVFEVELDGAATASVTMTLASPHTANRTVTLPDATTTLAGLDVAQTWNASQTFRDNQFSIVDNNDSGRIIMFQADGATSGFTLTLASVATANRTVTFPNATTTLVGLTGPSTQTFTGITLEFDNTANAFISDDPTGTPWFVLTDGATLAGLSVIADAAVSVDAFLTVPATGGILVTTLATQSITNKTLLTANTLRASSVSSGVAFVDNTTTSKALRHILSGLTASTNNSMTYTATAARDWEFRDAAGAIPVVGNLATASSTDNLASANHTAQSAAIGATNFTHTTAPVGMYLVTYYLECTTADAIEIDTVNFQISYTDDVGATTRTSANLGVAATTTGTTAVSGEFSFYVASGGVTYQTNISGSLGATAKYALRARIMYLGS